MTRPAYPVLEGTPYFNFEKRQLLIEGSHDIIPVEPVEVGHVRQLLADRHVVDSSWNLFRKIHQPERYEGNPVIAGELPEGGPGYPATVICDDRDGTLRLWTCMRDPQRPKYELDQVQVYYESEDGVHWRAPALGLVECAGTRSNNIIQGASGFSYGTISVAKAPPRLAARGQYVMVYLRNKRHLEPGETHGAELRIAWSEDGVRWKDQPENPVFRGRSDGGNYIVYNSQRDVFMIYRRPAVSAHEVRRIAYAESRDLVSWSQPITVIDADELDAPMLYGMSVTAYEGLYLGFPQMFYATNAGYHGGSRYWKDGRIEKYNCVDCQLAWSRDGIHWDRHPERPIFLETGLYGTYDGGATFVGQGFVERDGKLYLCYASNNTPHKPARGQGRRFHLNLATLRRDGFVSLGTPEGAMGPGYMLTRPLLCPGAKLRVNARTRKDGFMRVAVRSGNGIEDGCWLEGWNFQHGQPFSGDAIDAALAWKGKVSFDSLKGQSVRLHFWLKDAELFSFWFE